MGLSIQMEDVNGQFVIKLCVLSHPEMFSAIRTPELQAQHLKYPGLEVLGARPGNTNMAKVSQDLRMYVDDIGNLYSIESPTKQIELGHVSY